MDTSRVPAPGGGRGDVEAESPDNDTEPVEPPQKRQKRGSYVSNACDECQRRKIKCDSSRPCNPCHLSGRSCSRQKADLRRRERIRASPDDDGETRSSSSSRESSGRVTMRDLSDRLARVERLLEVTVTALLPAGGRATHDSGAPESIVMGGRDGSSATIALSTASSIVTARPSLLPGSTSTFPGAFSGETSIESSLQQVEAQLVLEQAGDAEDNHNLNHNQQSEMMMTTPVLTPVPTPAGAANGTFEGRGTSNLHQIFRKYDISGDGDQWPSLLDVFSDEVHILYPFLGRCELRKRYTLMTRSHRIFGHLGSEMLGAESRVSVAQVLLCLAIGQCTASPRVAGQGGRHSAGWSLYSAAMELFGPLLECFGECPDQMLVLQTLTLMVIYLFRLDIVSKAEKILVLAISHAHHLGLHRSQSDTTSSLTPAELESRHRLWWSLYILDRRLATETGHPFLISDLNVDTPLPRELPGGEDRFSNTSSQAGSIRAPPSETPIPYLVAMVSYSRVLGKVWEELYGTPGRYANGNPSMREYLERLLYGVQGQVPLEFRYSAEALGETHSPRAPWWFVKQKALMQIRWLSLRVLICKPTLQQQFTSTPRIIPRFFASEDESLTLHLTSRIIKHSMNLPAEQTVFTFPFFHDLLRAVIITLGLLVKGPSLREQCQELVVHGLRLLESFCHKTWASGKLVRTVARLGRIVSRLFGESNDDYDDDDGQRVPILSTGQPRAFETQAAEGPLYSSAQTPDELRVNTAVVSRSESFQEQQNPSGVQQVQADEIAGGNDPLNAGFSHLADLSMADFDFERDFVYPRGASLNTPSPQIGTSSQDTRHGRESVSRDLEWLRALFGDYLDADLIVGLDE
ncbi:fungal-specific transcription factor domain-containing protein [Aspergillus pseudoustus]|uniref:Fungal-specific transcription factor domain-containing protein n=1 Tax=Aspergillus pseudoustus TaxID=1810923 RepID=A0ABR4IZB5_9EURO